MSMNTGGVESIGNETNFNITFSSFFKGVSAMNRTSLTSLFRGWKKGSGKKLPALLAAGALAAMLNSCGDNVVESKGSGPSYDASNKTASVSVYFRNGGGTGDISNEGVTVEFYGTSGSSYEVQSVDIEREPKGKYHEVTRGGIVFKEVPLGNYAVRVSKTDFATYYNDEITVEELEAGNGGIFIPKATTVSALLYPLTGTVTGTAAYAGLSKSNASGPANGAEVTLTVQKKEIEHRVFRAQVSNGEFKFENVPAGFAEDGSALTGLVNANIGDYTSADKSVNLVPGVTSPISDKLSLVYLRNADAGLKILNFAASVEAESPIVLTFSDDVDELSVSKTTVSVTSDADGAVDVTRDVSGSKITITPLSGSWQTNFRTGEVSQTKKITIDFSGISSVNNRRVGGDTDAEIDVSTQLPDFYIVGSPDIGIAADTVPVTVKLSQPVDLEKYGDASYSFKNADGSAAITQPIKTPSFNDEGTEITFTPTYRWNVSSGGTIRLVFDRDKFVSTYGTQFDDESGDENVVKITLLSANHEKLAISTVNGSTYKPGTSFHKISITDTLASIVFVFNKAVDRTTVNPTITRTNAGAGGSRIEKTWSDDGKTLTVKPLDAWKKTTGTGAHILRFSAFQFSSSEQIQGLGTDGSVTDIAAGIQLRAENAIEYVGASVFELPSKSKQAVELLFNGEIDEGRITTAAPLKTVTRTSANTAAEGTQTAVTNALNVTLKSDKKTLVVTPVMDWNFGSDDSIKLVLEEDVGLYGLSASDPLDAAQFGVKLYKPASGVKTRQVDSVWLTRNPLSDSTKFAAAGHAVKINFSRVSDDAGYKYRLYRLTPGQTVTVSETESEEIATGDLAKVKAINATLAGGENTFYVVPVSGTDVGQPSKTVTITTRPTLDPAAVYGDLAKPTTTDNIAIGYSVNFNKSSQIKTQITIDTDPGTGDVIGGTAIEDTAYAVFTEAMAVDGFTINAEQWILVRGALEEPIISILDETQIDADVISALGTSETAYQLAARVLRVIIKTKPGAQKVKTSSYEAFEKVGGNKILLTNLTSKSGQPFFGYWEFDVSGVKQSKNETQLGISLP